MATQRSTLGNEADALLVSKHLVGRPVRSCTGTGCAHEALVDVGAGKYCDQQ